MPRFRDYTEWDSNHDQRNAKGMNEGENPFDDLEVQRRIAECIVRATLGTKERRPHS
jgi:hypothetical protein